MGFHEKVLTHDQKRALERLGPFTFKQDFYLAGGTALAIYLGHRRSRDFDWFTTGPISDAMNLAGLIREEGIPFSVRQVARGTLNGSVSKVPVSFFEYGYPLLRKVIYWPEFGCRLASLSDIACMKLSAIAQRGHKKDFVDLYALGTKSFSLKQMLSFYQKKFSLRDIGHVLFALSYFDDAEKERMPMMLWKFQWNTMKKAIQTWVKTLTNVQK
jgi:predicted nucleotidyltransferase component of viral defense system